VVAPTSLPPSLFFNKFMVLIEVTPFSWGIRGRFSWSAIIWRI
jgi:hypothetical protein